MKNRLSRKSEQDWMEMAERLTARVYKSGFKAGYDAAKDETPDVETMAQLLIKRYPGSELSDLMMAIDKLYPHIPIKSPNQQRAKLIQRARRFVEEHLKKDSVLGVLNIEGFLESYYPHLDYVDFVINDKKRTVVALLKYRQEKTVWAKSKAKCMPGDVFNADIGKAIALARALQIEVPKEFLQAVQPDKAVLGMLVYTASCLGNATVSNWTSTLRSTVSISAYNDLVLDETYGMPRIIDDTNAQYEVTS